MTFRDVPRVIEKPNFRTLPNLLEEPKAEPVTHCNLEFGQPLRRRATQRQATENGRKPAIC
jgi:hypothetical protein